MLFSSLDYVNIMTYDNAGMWNPVTAHHAAFDWVINSMNFWSTKVIKSKLLMGVPFYGVSFTLEDPNQHGIGAPVTASSDLTYLQICTNVEDNGWTKEYIDPDGPIAYEGNQWVGYDDANSIMEYLN
jgi:chitinase